MNRFHTMIEKRNFKRIFLVYVIAALLCAVLCAGAVGYVYRDKIALALQYERTSEAFYKQNTEGQRQSIDKLAAASDDICDVLLLDGQNHIVYSAKQSEFAAGGILELKKAEGSRFLQSDAHPDAAFRFVKKDEWMLSAAFADRFSEIYEEYDEDSFYMERFQNKTLYTVSLLRPKGGDVKAYVISNPAPVPYGMLTLKIAASVLMLLFMIYWIIVALWVYQNARRSKLSAPAWGIVTLFTNLAGVLVYLVYKYLNSVCVSCGAVQARSNVFCTNCGSKIGTTCSACGHGLKPSDHYCPKCGQKRG